MIQSFLLHDGRKLAYGNYGDLAGEPLLFLHGYPGTNLMAQLAQEGAQKYGFRLIAPDRPGMGDSDFLQGRALHHYSIDVLQLLNRLGIDRCGIVAISGGSPYAFQLAHDLPQRIRFVASLSGWLSYGRPEAQSIKIDCIFRIFGWSMNHVRPVAALTVRSIAYMLQHHIDKALARLIHDLPEADKAILRNPRYRAIVAADLQNAVKQGWQGVYQDAQIQFSHPAFALQSVQQPVILLHGKQDTVAPFTFMQILKRQLPNVFAVLELERAGHFCAVTEQDWIFETIHRLMNQRAV